MDGNSLFVMVAVGSAAGFVVATPWSWVIRRGADNRTYEDFIRDIGEINHNNSYFVGAILIFFGFAFTRGELPHVALGLLLVAFIFGSVSLFFFPVVKPASSASSSVRPSLRWVRRFWLFKVVTSQCCVIFAVFGIYNAMIDQIHG
jgi:uncharacterized membrane protein